MTDDRLAPLVYQAAQFCGLTIPKELVVIGYGDLAVSSLLTPTRTTIRVDYEALGRAAAAMVIDRCNKVSPVAALTY